MSCSYSGGGCVFSLKTIEGFEVKRAMDREPSNPKMDNNRVDANHSPTTVEFAKSGDRRHPDGIVSRPCTNATGDTIPAVTYRR